MRGRVPHVVQAAGEAVGLVGEQRLLLVQRVVHAFKVAQARCIQPGLAQGRAGPHVAAHRAGVVRVVGPQPAGVKQCVDPRHEDAAGRYLEGGQGVGVIRGLRGMKGVGVIRRLRGMKGAGVTRGHLRWGYVTYVGVGVGF